MPTKRIFKFFEYLMRMVYIIRWALMRNTRQEDVKQHSFDVAVLAHGLVVIRNSMFPQSRPLDPGKASTYALFHDATEVFTGDIPTPIKYFGGGAMKGILDRLEKVAVDKMITSLPDAMRPAYKDVFDIPPEYKAVIKAADRLAALRKCQDEISAGNMEFSKAAYRLEEALNASGLPEVQYFMGNFVPDRPMSLDELIEGNGSWLIEDEAA